MNCGEYPRANTLARARIERDHGHFRVTHFLEYDDETIGELCWFNGAYYTREQFEHGEPGLRRGDLREGEAIVKAYANAGGA